MNVFRVGLASLVSIGFLAATAAPAAGLRVDRTGRSHPAVVADRGLQTRTISGTVADSVTGEPASVGQVVIAGTTTGAMIQQNGHFTVIAPLRPVALTVRSLGHKPKTVTVPLEENTVAVVLARDNFRLEEVVVTGQASGIEKKNLATSVTTLDASEIDQVPAATIERAMQGKVPGAQISSNSGAPGGGSIVRMRGVTSIIGAFTPLYVVDGVIVSDATLGTGTNPILQANGRTLSPTVDNQDNDANRIADLNPGDIERIEVLKGASASAIYGSKASNGVILITTKRGRVGAPQYLLSQRVGESELSHKFGVRCFSLNDAVAAFGAQAASTYTPACHDYEQELYGSKPISTETSVGMNGGTEGTRYFLSLLAKHDGGIIPNSFANKKSIRVNVDQLLGSRATLAVSAQGIQTERDPQLTNNENNGLAIPSALAYGGTTWLDLRRRLDGSYPINPFNANNPFQTAALFQNREKVWRGILSGRLSVDLLSSTSQTLRFLANGGGDLFTQQNAVLSPPELYVEQTTGRPGHSALSYGQSNSTNISANLVHTYELSGGTATTQVGVQAESRDLDASHTLTEGLIGGLSSIDAGLGVRVEQHRERVRDQGFFGQEELLLLNERLLLTLGARADRSTNNADVKKLFFYPKASVSYRMPNLGPGVDELKFRVAAGQSGNEPLYGQKFTELTPNNIGGLFPTASIQGGAGAPDLRPERQREIETGFDATMLHSRANIEFTVYDKRISDLLLQRTLAPTTGLAQLVFNGGSMRTRGLELAATAIPIQNSRLTWTTRGTYSLNRCKILSLPVPAFRPNSFLNDPVFGMTFIEPGKSCTQLLGTDTLGAQPGDAKLGPPGTSLVRQLGDANPEYIYSFSNDFAYKAFHFSLLLDGRKGGMLANITELEYDFSMTSPDYSVPRKRGELTGAQRVASFGKTARTYLQDASYMKVREAKLSYDVPAARVQGLIGSARNLSVSLSGRNLYTFTNYQSTGDPEGNQVATSTAREVPWDLWAYPPSRTFWLSVDLGF